MCLGFFTSFPLVGTVFTAAVNIHVHKLWWMWVLLSLGFLSGSGIAGSQGVCRWLVLPKTSWNWSWPFPVPFATSSPAHTASLSHFRHSGGSVIVHLQWIVWIYIVDLVCISWMISYIEDISICLMAFWMYSFAINFAKTSPILKFMLTEFFILIIGVLYIFCMWVLAIHSVCKSFLIYIENSFSQSRVWPTIVCGPNPSCGLFLYGVQVKSGCYNF